MIIWLVWFNSVQNAADEKQIGVAMDEFTYKDVAKMKKMLSAMLILSLLSSAAATAAGGGELWKITTKMSMSGMDMPAMTQTSCLPKGGAYKPGKDPQRENCEVTDLHVAGNQTTWKMHCSGKDAMDGSGEVTRGTDSLNGTLKLSMRGGEMTEIISGKRTGACQEK